jgi:predicted RNA binding protein with dsRBD fold (UPF0201 family)
MNEISVHVEVEVNPTEDLEKVKQAVENIFGAVTFKVESRTWGHLLIAKTAGTGGLTKMHNILARERIRAAARKVFLAGMDDKSVTFYLNKQVAYAGHISFCQKTAESPLGPISVQISCSNPRELIKWLTPKPTKRTPPPHRPK